MNYVPKYFLFKLNCRSFLRNVSYLYIDYIIVNLSLTMSHCVWGYDASIDPRDITTVQDYVFHIAFIYFIFILCISLNNMYLYLFSSWN